MSRRLEWTALVASMALSGIGVALFWLSVGHRLLSSPLRLFGVEGVIVVAQMVLLGFASFLRRRGVG